MKKILMALILMVWSTTAYAISMDSGSGGITNPTANLTVTSVLSASAPGTQTSDCGLRIGDGSTGAIKLGSIAAWCESGLYKIGAGLHLRRNVSIDSYTPMNLLMNTADFGTNTISCQDYAINTAEDNNRQRTIGRIASRLINTGTSTYAADLEFITAINGVLTEVGQANGTDTAQGVAGTWDIPKAYIGTATVVNGSATTLAVTNLTTYGDTQNSSGTYTVTTTDGNYIINPNDEFVVKGKNMLKVSPLFLAWAGSVTSTAGTRTDILWQGTITSDLMTNNSIIEINTVWNWNASGANKTAEIKIGSSTFQNLMLNEAVVSNSSAQHAIMIRNKNSKQAQLVYPYNASGWNAPWSVTLANAQVADTTIDFTGTQTIMIYGSSTVADWIALRAVNVYVKVPYGE